jgi:rhomboid family GlyGly-CTERM serine protease
MTTTPFVRALSTTGADDNTHVLMPIVNGDPFGKFGLAAKRLWHRGAVPLVIGACCFALALGGEPARDWGSYDRAAIGSGQVWRLITGNLVHLGWAHLWPNLLALLLIGGLLEEFLNPLEWLAASIVTGVAISAGLYLFQPDTQWYVGLSGVLHGLVACGAVMMMGARAAALGASLGVGLALKLVWEQVYGPVPLTAASVGGAVVVPAHLYGAIAGAIAGLAFWIVRRRTARL